LAIAAAAAIAVTTTETPAFGASISDDGTFVFDADTVAKLDFESDVIVEEGGPSLSVEDEGALEGKRVLSLGAFAGADLPVQLLAGAQTYRVSAWIRGGETIVDLEVRYADNAHAGVDELSTLYPTGRMTSDGWVEVQNDGIRIDGGRSPAVSIGFFSAAGSAIDAVEIVSDGTMSPEEKSGRACAGATDTSCGQQQQCQFSQCRYVGGWVPPIPADRDAVAAYLRARADLLFGPYINRTRDLPSARVAFDRMATATDRWTYWNGFLLGVRLLHDGHTTTSGIASFVLENEKPLALCFLEGDADLSHGVAPKDPQYLDVVVSHVGPFRNLGLGPGDRLLYVDGQHPIAWARSLVELHWGMSPVSNHETYAELAESLRGLIARYAHTVTVIRWDAESGTCSDAETIDLSAIAPIAEGEPFEGVACDNRPLRHLADSPPNHAATDYYKVHFGIVNESNATERIYGAEWESLYTTNGNDGAGAGLKAAVEAFRADATGVILDHRTGNGGTIRAPQILWDFAVPRHPVSVYLDRQRAEDEQPDIMTGLWTFDEGVNRGLADFGGSDLHVTMPVALLLTRDVSASDWLPLGFKGIAPHVKIFAPYETNGAFSTRYGFGYWLGMSYVIAVGDTFDAEGRTHNGRGVAPDFVVLPKQSDLVIGKDTVYEAALAWVRQEIGQ
jgi:hypothetical protein